MRSIKIIFIIVILLMCAAPLLLAFSGIDSPSVEKQALARAPELISADGQINRKFTADLDRYIADNFPLRSWMISAWHYLNSRLLGQSGNDQVIIGRDGWLFYASTVPAYTAQDRFTPAEYTRLDAILRLQADYLESRGIAFIYTVVPNKNSIHPNLMPRRYDNRTSENTLAGLAEQLSTPGYLDLQKLLKAEADVNAQPLYHQTDSHWNNRGALIASTALLDEAGRMHGSKLPNPYLSAANSEAADWPGDLAVMLYPSGPQLDLQQHFAVSQNYRYTRPLRSLEDLLIMTQGAGSNSLLMFRDSFANALIPMLSASFADAAYSRAVPYDYALLDQTGADVVILEIVERNLRDWLSEVPRMPASEYRGEPLQTLSTLPGQITVEIQKDGSWQKIRGQLTSSQITADWTRILVSVDGKLFEAFPVTDKDQPATVGFALHFAKDKWAAETLINEVLVETGAGWLSYQIA